MNQIEQFQDPSDGVDHAMLQHMLSLGGDDLRPVLVAQLRTDLARLREALTLEEPGPLKQASHELKGLSATIGAVALAKLSARFDDLGDGLTVAARGAMALGLRIEIDRLDRILQSQAHPVRPA